MWVIIVTNEGYKAVKSRLHVKKKNRQYRFYLVRDFNNSIPTIIFESSSRLFLSLFLFLFFVLIASDFLHSSLTTFHVIHEPLIYNILLLTIIV
jgi:hypothetical protein